jgi:branched-chain amino acid transport system ATP-binding protein
MERPTTCAFGMPRKSISASVSPARSQVLTGSSTCVLRPAPQFVRELGNVLEALKKDISILLVEQNLGLAMKLADDIVLLNTGRVVFAGTREEFEARQPELQRHLGIS